jgi:FtsP/CotA-like multicopper oxidase with cupredoxin domain
MPATVDMHAAQPVSTYTYDGIVPGRTWELLSGDTLQVELINDLPEIEHPHDLSQPFATHRPHEWTTTNLHTHGLHVSPEGNADNIFLSVPPGATQQYEIAISDDHPGGIFWYHPHRHGAVCQQVRAGMAGMIVVRGEIDEVPEVAAAREQIMVLQAIELGNDFELLDPIPFPTKEQAFFPRTQILYTVNGVLNPKITMYPGEVQRWRMLNAAEGKFMSLTLEEHDLNVLAWDGLTLAAPEPTNIAMLSGGNRVEALIKAGAPGIYHLMLTPGSSQRPDIPGMPGGQETSADTHDGHGPTPTPASGELAVRSILTIEVVGEGPEMALPAALPAFDPPMLPIAKQRRFAYTVERDENLEFETFGVNGEPFDIDRPPYQVKLNTAEEWTLVNDLDDKLPRHAHVFHIHVNAFRVTKINGVALEKPLWRDTFVLPGGDDDSITFESNFVDFTGKFVNHCHVLSHEDLGMMEAVEVIP